MENILAEIIKKDGILYREATTFTGPLFIIFNLFGFMTSTASYLVGTIHGSVIDNPDFSCEAC